MFKRKIIVRLQLDRKFSWNLFNKNGAWNLKTRQQCKVLSVGVRILYIASDRKIKPKKCLENPGVFWLWGQMCPASISWLCFLLLPLSSVPFSTILSSPWALDFVSLFSHILGNNDSLLSCAFRRGERKEKGQRRKWKKGQEGSGRRAECKLVSASFLQNPSKGLCLSCDPD